mgnify:CR=1 FL=1
MTHRHLPAKRILLVIASLCMVFALTACSFQNVRGIFTKDGAEPVEKYTLNLDGDGKITDLTLVHAITAGINGKYNLEAIYDAIPSRLRQDLTRAEFKKYIEALKDNHPKIEYYSHVEPAEAARLVEQTTATLPELTGLAEGSEYYRLGTQKATSESREGQIVAIQHTDDGEAYLSAKWIRHIIDLYDFTQLYFSALDNKDKASLSWLLMLGEPEANREGLEELENIRASRLMQFYRDIISTPPLMSRCTVLVPGHAEFSQALYVAPSNPEGRRSCYFKQYADRIEVEDPIKEEMYLRHTYVYKDDGIVLDWLREGIRTPSNNGRFEDTLGRIRGMTAEHTEYGATLWQVRYPDISLWISGEGRLSDRYWRGYIEQIELNGSKRGYSLGKELYVGMPVYELYMAYPFIRESGFVITGTFDGIKIEMTVEIQNNIVQRIIMKRVRE